MSKKDEIYEQIHAGHRERVYEAVRRDPDLDTFSDIEVLEYLLFPVTPRVDTNPIAHQLLEKFGSLVSVLQATPEDLLQVSGVTKNASKLLPAILPVARRAEISRAKFTQGVFTNLSQAVNYLQKFFINRNQELLCMVSLDINDKVLQNDIIAKGDTNSIQFNTRTIVSHAVRNGATKVLIAHNHPAGTLQPSDEDIRTTYNIVSALAPIGVALADHIIFNTLGFFSFFNNGVIFDAYEKYDKIMGTGFVRDRAKRRKYYIDMTEYILEPRMDRAYLRKASDDDYEATFKTEAEVEAERKEARRLARAMAKAADKPPKN